MRGKVRSLSLLLATIAAVFTALTNSLVTANSTAVALQDDVRDACRVHVYPRLMGHVEADGLGRRVAVCFMYRTRVMMIHAMRIYT